MADRLKIYACSGIGETENKPISYWTDGTNTIANTQAVNTLLVAINGAWIRLTRLAGLSKEDKIALLNEIDWLSVALDAAKRFKGDNEKLYHAGEVISDMAKNGAFEGTSTDLREREERLEELIEKANELYSDDAVKSEDPEFMAWWKNTIVARNKVGLNFGEQQSMRKALKKAAEQIKGIGKADESWKENADLSEYLLNGSEYFLYTYFTDAQLAKLPAVFKSKRKEQLRIYDFCKSEFVDIYGSEEDMREIISDGIINYFGQTPQYVCNKIATTGKIEKPIGTGDPTGAVVWTAAEIISLISALLTFVMGVVGAVLAYLKSKNDAKYGAINAEAAKSATPAPGDYDGLNIGGGTGLSKGSSWLPIVAIGAGLLLLLKK